MPKPKPKRQPDLLALIRDLQQALDVLELQGLYQQHPDLVKVLPPLLHRLVRIWLFHP
jgi:hypothetical protein